LLLLDVDGVLTDGGIAFVGASEEMKRFHSQDGLGISLARQRGLQVGVISGRVSQAVQRRAHELKIDPLYQGISDKLQVLQDLLDKQDLSPTQVAYIGDDLPDIPVMQQVGIPIAVHNARPAVKRCALYVTRASGGEGAVREAIEWILRWRGSCIGVMEA
jgi:3-deoxy-D-manno-octulosonate 8-phosphate phosphatase (KDO 8-P phosphatase)